MAEQFAIRINGSFQSTIGNIEILSTANQLIVDAISFEFSRKDQILKIENQVVEVNELIKDTFANIYVVSIFVLRKLYPLNDFFVVTSNDLEFKLASEVIETITKNDFDMSRGFNVLTVESSKKFVSK